MLDQNQLSTIEDVLKQSTFIIAILRSVYHLITASGAAYVILDGLFPCTFETCPKVEFTGLVYFILFFYCLLDLVNLPQEVFYIWAVSSPDADFSNSIFQSVSFGLPFINILGIVLLIAAMIDSKTLITFETMMPWVPHIISMIGSFSFAAFIGFN